MIVFFIFAFFVLKIDLRNQNTRYKVLLSKNKTNKQVYFLYKDSVRGYENNLLNDIF